LRVHDEVDIPKLIKEGSLYKRLDLTCRSRNVTLQNEFMLVFEIVNSGDHGEIIPVFYRVLFILVVLITYVRSSKHLLLQLKLFIRSFCFIENLEDVLKSVIVFEVNEFFWRPIFKEFHHVLSIAILYQLKSF